MGGSAGSVTGTRSGEYCLLEIALPGRRPENAGVLLLDPEADELHYLLRRDWDAIAEPEDAEVLAALEEDLGWKTRELGARRFLEILEDSLSNVLRVTGRQSVLVEDFARSLRRLYRQHVHASVLPFRTHLPAYSLRAAAGKWGDGMEVEPEGFLEVLDDIRLTQDMFVAHVQGKSMEPKIPDGSLCIFRAGVAGSRSGRDVLVENFGLAENEGRYTVKRYVSEKRYTQDGWEHTRITLKPLNPEFEPWDLEPGQFRVLAEFVRVLE